MSNSPSIIRESRSHTYRIGFRSDPTRLSLLRLCKRSFKLLIVAFQYNVYYHEQRKGFGGDLCIFLHESNQIKQNHNHGLGSRSTMFAFDLYSGDVVTRQHLQLLNNYKCRYQPQLSSEDNGRGGCRKNFIRILMSNQTSRK